MSVQYFLFVPVLSALFVLPTQEESAYPVYYLMIHVELDERDIVSRANQYIVQSEGVAESRTPNSPY